MRFCVFEEASGLCLLDLLSDKSLALTQEQKVKSLISESESTREEDTRALIYGFSKSWLTLSTKLLNPHKTKSCSDGYFAVRCTNALYIHGLRTSRLMFVCLSHSGGGGFVDLAGLVERLLGMTILHPLRLVVPDALWQREAVHKAITAWVLKT